MKLNCVLFLGILACLPCVLNGSDYDDKERSDGAFSYGQSSSGEEYVPLQVLPFICSDDDPVSAFNDDIQDGLHKQDLPICPATDSDEDLFATKTYEQDRPASADPVTKEATKIVRAYVIQALNIRMSHSH